jgi:hypothetical protein
VHVCVDDATRLAYVEVLADERASTAIGFLHRAKTDAEEQGLTSAQRFVNASAGYSNPYLPRRRRHGEDRA